MSDAVPRRIAHASSGVMRLHSIYRSAINIDTGDGLLTIASVDTGGLPNGIVADLGPDWRRLGLEPGIAVYAHGGRVCLPDARLEITLEYAARWSPRFPASGETSRSATPMWRRRAGATRAIARARASGGGFGPLLGEDAGSDDLLGTAWVARPVLHRLTAALEIGDRHAATELARHLIGLGPGLTPSGDDALVGIEAALHALDSPMAGFLAPAVNDADDRTTAVAATLLRHAAAGEFAERLHQLLGALLGPDDRAIAEAIDRASAWGATSGTDCLLGVLIGLDAAAGVRATVH